MERIFLHTLIFFTSCFMLIDCKKADEEVTDYKWQVESIKVHKDSVVRFASSGQTYVLSFEGKINYNIKLDVNTCGGELIFKRGSNNITFASAACSEACCDSDFAQKTVSILQEVKRYEIVDNKLVLFSDDSKKIDLIKQ